MDLPVFFLTTTPHAIRKPPVHFWTGWVESLNMDPLVPFVPTKVVCNNVCNSSSLKKKDYRPKSLLQSPIYRKAKGTISELHPGETAISPLVLATHTDLAWSTSVFSSDPQTSRDWTPISTVAVAGNASSEQYYPNGIKTWLISPG